MHLIVTPISVYLQMKNLDAIFFSAHPDDVELSAGGTVIALVKAGYKIGIVDLTQGELSTRGNLKSRAIETKNATKVMGIHARENLKIQDGNIENNEKNRKKIIEVVRKYRPKIVFAPYPKDRHPDHINASNLLRESFFYAGLSKIKTKSPSFRPSKVFYYAQHFDIPTSFIFDITDTYEQKIEAVKCYKTQFFTDEKGPQTYISGKSFGDNLEARSIQWGFQIGAKYGEPFFTESDLKITEDTLFKI